MKSFLKKLALVPLAALSLGALAQAAPAKTDLPRFDRGPISVAKNIGHKVRAALPQPRLAANHKRGVHVAAKPARHVHNWRWATRRIYVQPVYQRRVVGYDNCGNPIYRRVCVSQGYWSTKRYRTCGCGSHLGY